MFFFAFLSSLVAFLLVARFTVLQSFLLASFRSLYALYAFKLFPDADTNILYWPRIQSYSCQHSLSLTDFHFLGHLLHCHIPDLTITQLNLLTSIVSSYVLSLLIYILRRASSFRFSFTPTELPSSLSWFQSNILFISMIDPATIMYTTCFGKDYLTYLLLLAVSILVLTRLRNTLHLTLLASLFFLLLAAHFDYRLYVIAMLSGSILFSLFFSSYTFSWDIPTKLRPAIRYKLKVSLLRTLFTILFLFSSILLVSFFLSSTSSRLLESIQTTNMGGSLSVSMDNPLPFKILMFLFFPLPFYPLSLSYLPFAISSIIFATLLFFTFWYKIKLDRLFSSFVVVWLLIVVTINSYTLSNLGIAVRYRTQFLLPPLVVLTYSLTRKHSF